MLLYSFFYLSLSLYVAILRVRFPVRGADHLGRHLRRDHHRHVLLPGTLTTHSLHSPTPCVYVPCGYNPFILSISLVSVAVQ